MSKGKGVRSDMEAKKKDRTITHGILEVIELIGTILHDEFSIVHIFSLNMLNKWVDEKKLINERNDDT